MVPDKARAAPDGRWDTRSGLLQVADERVDNRSLPAVAVKATPCRFQSK